MTDTVTFYHNPQSRGRMVHWMLEEVGAPYEVKLLNFTTRDHKSEEFLRINPMGKVPAIVHRGVVVTETPAICAYLADAFADAGLAPALDDPARGTYLRWLFFGYGCLEPAVIDRIAQRPPGEQPGMLSYGSYEETLGAVEQALTPGPYLLGERFSAADVYLAASLGFAMMMKGIDERPVFKQYVARCEERPAHKRFAEHCDELAEQLKASA
jgi:glutathione S-transferase